MIKLLNSLPTNIVVVVAAVVAAVVNLVAILGAQLLQHVFTSRRERHKTLEKLRTDLYQEIINHVRDAQYALFESEYRRVDDYITRAIKIFRDKSNIVSPQFAGVLGQLPFRDEDGNYKYSYYRVGNELSRIENKLERIARKELGVVTLHYRFIDAVSRAWHVRYRFTHAVSIKFYRTRSRLFRLFRAPRSR
jgi:hypothetical protein